MSEEQESKELVPELERRAVPWRYRHFVEGVAAERVAEQTGVDPSRMARVFAKGDTKSGKDQVHIVGSPDVVREVATNLESSKRELHTWYIGEADSPEEERAVVCPAFEEFVRSIPTPIIDNPAEFVRKALVLPARSLEAARGRLEQAVDKLSEGGSPFQKLGERLQNEKKGVSGGKK